VIGLVVTGCASHTPYQDSLDKAFAELEDQASRTLAGVTQGIDIDSLTKFKMVVFPKAIDHHVKMRKYQSIDKNLLSEMDEQERDKYIDSKTVYHTPLTFNFNVLKKGLCMNLVKTKKYATHLFFGGEDFDSKIKCMVLEVKKEVPHFFGKRIMDLKKDDILRVRVYLDEYLRPYGHSVDYAVKQGREPYRTENIKTDKRENSSSGLSMYPIDLPNFKNSSVVNKAEDSVPLPRNLFLIFSIKSKVKTPICKKAKLFEHKDILGNIVESSWCDKQNWPTTIENNRFFAVLK
ncbi:MAG: hypothetical protein OEY33_05425, partial [Bdellovibrionales bacterium]|nr:hypothetical protein [Bdellovibrionales bacterium]